jgi:hypothetical protein
MHEFPKREGESFTIFCREQMPESKFVVEALTRGRERERFERRLNAQTFAGWFGCWLSKNGESFDKKSQRPLFVCVENFKIKKKKIVMNCGRWNSESPPAANRTLSDLIDREFVADCQSSSLNSPQQLCFSSPFYGDKTPDMDPFPRD